MNRAEPIVAIVMALCSIGLMVKSAELPVGWISGEGPGGGAFPFWLGAGMLVCCVWTVIKWLRGASPYSDSDKPYMDRKTLMLFVTAAGSLTVMIGLIHFIGVYFAVPALLVFYVRFIGRHSWWLTSIIAAATPVVTFFFFEIALRITLPKGHTEPMFYPLYDLFL